MNLIQPANTNSGLRRARSAYDEVSVVLNDD